MSALVQTDVIVLPHALWATEDMCNYPLRFLRGREDRPRLAGGRKVEAGEIEAPWSADAVHVTRLLIRADSRRKVHERLAIDDFPVQASAVGSVAP